MVRGSIDLRQWSLQRRRESVEGGKGGRESGAKIVPSKNRVAIERERCWITGRDKSQPATDQAQPEFQQGLEPRPGTVETSQGDQRALVQQFGVPGGGWMFGRVWRQPVRKQQSNDRGTIVLFEGSSHQDAKSHRHHFRKGR